MRILAIDPGGNTGWCLGDHDGLTPPKIGTYRVPKVRNELDAQTAYKFVCLEAFLMEIIKHNLIDKVVFEEPFSQSSGSFGNRSFQSEVTRWGYAAVIGMAALKCGVLCIPVHLSSWRSGAGVPTRAPTKPKMTTEQRRKWLKAQGMARCLQLGFTVTSDDEADATLLWYSQTQKIRDKEAAPDLFAAVTL